VLESLGSYWASAYRDVIVFTLLIPVLAWLSLRAGSGEERAKGLLKNNRIGFEWGIPARGAGRVAFGRVGRGGHRAALRSA